MRAVCTIAALMCFAWASSGGTKATQEKELTTEHLKILGTLKKQADFSLKLLKTCAEVRGWTDPKKAEYPQRHIDLVNTICNKQFGNIDQENAGLADDIKKIKISASLHGKYTNSALKPYTVRKNDALRFFTCLCHAVSYSRAIRGYKRTCQLIDVDNICSLLLLTVQLITVRRANATLPTDFLWDFVVPLLSICSN